MFGWLSGRRRPKPNVSFLTSRRCETGPVSVWLLRTMSYKLNNGLPTVLARVWGKGTPRACGGTVKRRGLETSKIEPPYDSATPPLGIYLKKSKILV